jgi:hypothetical protein
MSCRNSEFGFGTPSLNLSFRDVGYGLSSYSAAEALERQGSLVNPTLSNQFW